MRYNNAIVVGQRKALIERLLANSYKHQWQVDRIISAIMDRLPERVYDLVEDGYSYDRIWADGVEDAISEAVARFDATAYRPTISTVWVEISARDVADGERGWATMTVDPEEPECADGRDHQWDAPYSVLGGLKENPGVWGSGGGVEITTVCRYCGAYRTIDTWAQNPATGEEGLESVAYRDADCLSERYVEEMKTLDG